jgi:hypothetical protein
LNLERPEIVNATSELTPAGSEVMALDGLLQWAIAVTTQAERIERARAHHRDPGVIVDDTARHDAVLSIHTESHYFCIAAYKVIEYKEWAVSLGLGHDVDFTELDRFNQQDLKDIRNMREHVVEYFSGAGHQMNRWVIATPGGGSADASTMCGDLIGGRLDFRKFANATQQLLPNLRALPRPSPLPPGIAPLSGAPPNK